MRSFLWRCALDSVILLGLLCAALFFALLGYAAPRAADLPMSTPSAIMPERSFHDLERFPDRTPYRWTADESRLGVPNPGGMLRLRLRLLDGPAGHTPLRLRAAGLALDFAVRPGIRRYELLLPPSAGERVELIFSSPTVPLAGRSLGVALIGVRLAGGAAPPGQAPLVLAAATLGAYALLRRAGQRLPAAALMTLALQGLAALWLHLGGWQYALLARALLPLGAAALLAALLDRPTTNDQRPMTSAPGSGFDHVGGVVRRSSVVPLALLLALALAVRLPWLLAPDPTGDLELAARRMYYLYTEGLAGAYRRGGDYMPLRLYILWGLSQVVGAAGASFAEPIAPLTMLLVKLPQLTADLATAAVVYAVQRSVFSVQRSAFLLAALYTLAPPVWINSAWWGQVDALLMLPMLGAVLLLERAGGRWAWACWALALLIKAQAIILAPVLYVATLRRHGARGLLAGAAVAAGVFAAGCAPLALAGQGFGLAEAYQGAVGRFPRTTYGAYNLWHLALGGAAVNDFDAALGPLSYRQIGLALLGAATLLVCAALWRRSDGPGRVEAAAAVALAFFTLPTQMHARYAFLSLAFVALAASADRRLAGLFLALATCATLNLLGILSGFWPAATAFVRASPLPLVCAVVNLAALGVLLARLLYAAFAPVVEREHEDTKTRRREGRYV
ncbi:MAG TPA: glycosyltransferase 87 family protein [Roseiflexaceae bacterium]|nr:glycosyltransferase 87 family protein [Roseiflexaceae bacterium]